MVRMTFDEIRLRRMVPTFCRGCNKKLQRVISDFQTVNPYNSNAADDIKTPNEIRAELRVNLDAKTLQLRQSGVICRACENAP
jgi:hypothetical protein